MGGVDEGEEGERQEKKGGTLVMERWERSRGMMSSFNPHAALLSPLPFPPQIRLPPLLSSPCLSPAALYLDLCSCVYVCVFQSCRHCSFLYVAAPFHQNHPPPTPLSPSSRAHHPFYVTSFPSLCSRSFFLSSSSVYLKDAYGEVPSFSYCQQIPELTTNPRTNNDSILQTSICCVPEVSIVK